MSIINQAVNARSKKQILEENAVRKAPQDRSRDDNSEAEGRDVKGIKLYIEDPRVQDEQEEQNSIEACVRKCINPRPRLSGHRETCWRHLVSITGADLHNQQRAFALRR